MTMHSPVDRRIIIEAFEVLTVGAAPVGCTVATVRMTGDASGPEYGYFSVESSPIRYRMDGGLPTTTVGHLAYPGQNIEIHGHDNFRNLRMIATGDTATVMVSYGW